MTENLSDSENNQEQALEVSESGVQSGLPGRPEAEREELLSEKIDTLERELDELAGDPRHPPVEHLLPTVQIEEVEALLGDSNLQLPAEKLAAMYDQFGHSRDVAEALIRQQECPYAVLEALRERYGDDLLPVGLRRRNDPETSTGIARPERLGRLRRRNDPETSTGIARPEMLGRLVATVERIFESFPAEMDEDRCVEVDIPVGRCNLKLTRAASPEASILIRKPPAEDVDSYEWSYEIVYGMCSSADSRHILLLKDQERGEISTYEGGVSLLLSESEAKKIKKDLAKVARLNG